MLNEYNEITYLNTGISLRIFSTVKPIISNTPIKRFICHILYNLIIENRFRH